METTAIDHISADYFVAGLRQMCSEGLNVNHQEPRMRVEGRLEIGIRSKVNLLLTHIDPEKAPSSSRMWPADLRQSQNAEIELRQACSELGGTAICT